MALELTSSNNLSNPTLIKPYSKQVYRHLIAEKIKFPTGFNS